MERKTLKNDNYEKNNSDNKKTRKGNLEMMIRERANLKKDKYEGDKYEK